MFRVVGMGHNNMLDLRKFVAPEFVFGAGAANLAGRYARNFGGSKVLVVTDENCISFGHAGEVLASLEKAGVRAATFSDVNPNPSAEEVTEGARVYRQEDCNLIVAVGGGSPMDCAKGIGIVSSNGSSITAFEGVDNVPAPCPPLICIPTTAGTSADVSQFAIIRDAARKTKITIVSKTVVPDVALIDPRMTLSMSPELTACTGIDAFTHAAEAYVSNASSPLTDLHALEAMKLIRGSLPEAYARPGDLEARARVMLGSLHAGLAFSNASLGAVHAMAHSLGGQLDLPHGLCNALLLRPVLKFNFSAAPERYGRIAEALGAPAAGTSPEDAGQSLLDRLTELLRSVDLDSSLSAAGVGEEAIPTLAAKAFADPCLVTNPRRARLEDLEELFRNAL